jgi:hypothetical protein
MSVIFHSFKENLFSAFYLNLFVIHANPWALENLALYKGEPETEKLLTN